MRCDVLPDWFDDARKIAENPLGFKRVCKARFAFETFLQEKCSQEVLTNRLTEADHTAWVKADLDRCFKRAKECFEKGEGYVDRLQPWLERFARERNNGQYPVELRRWFDFCSIVGLLRAYLSLLKEKAGVAPGKDNIVERDENGEVNKTDHSKQALCRFDPRGGAFTTEPNYRRTSFMLRSALTMSLFDLTEKAKFVYCKEEVKS